MPITITALPAVPSRNSAPDTFSEDADNFLGALPNFRGELNALGAEVEASRDTSTTSAATAVSGAATATTQAGISTTQAGISNTQAGISTTQAGISTTKAGEAAASAAAALTSENNADAQEAAALASEVRANEWSEKATAVLPGQYSAKYWAQQASAATLGVLVYRGTHDASTGVYPVVVGTGDYWKISVSGTISGNVFQIGDSILYNGSTWDKIDSNDEVTSVAGRVGAVVLDKTDVGLSNVDNTTDANKPISTATQTALDLKAPSANPTYTGTLTGGTGVVNLGSGQFVKDAAGNVGLGVTPSAWASGYKALELTGGAFVGISTSIFDTPQNAYYQISGYTYKTTNPASMYRQSAGAHTWYTAPSGTAGNPIAFTPAMTLFASGGLNVGGAIDPGAGVIRTNGTTGSASPQLDLVSSGFWTWRLRGDGNTLRFMRDNTTDMTLDTNGELTVGTGGATRYVRVRGYSDGYLQFGYDSNGSAAFYSSPSFSSNTDGSYMWFGGSGTKYMTLDASGNLLVGTTSGLLSSKMVVSNGSQTWSYGPRTGDSSFYVTNSSGIGMYIAPGNQSWTAVSDGRLKDIIEPITGAAQRLKSWRTVVGKYKTDTDDVRRLFFIAQDILANTPEAVETSNPDRYGVQYTDTIPVVAAAVNEHTVQIEAMAQTIEAMQAQLDAQNSAVQLLASRLAALEAA